MKRATFWRLIRYGVGGGLIVLLIPTFFQPEFIESLRTVNFPLLGLSLILSILSVASKAWRWGIVLRHRGIAVKSTSLLITYFIGMFFNNFLPSGIGGDAIRAVASARETGKPAEAITAVILERGSGMLALFTAGSVGLLLYPGHGLPIGVVILVHGLFIGAIMGTWLLWQGFTGKLLSRIGKWIDSHAPRPLSKAWGMGLSVYEEFRSYRTERRLLFDILWQSVVTLLLTIASLYALIGALGQTVSIGGFAAAISIATAIDLIPISPNGLGVREGVYIYLLGQLGVSAGVGLAFGILIRLLVLIQALIGGVAFVTRGVRVAEGQPT
jgi:uncharacterized protein (TIRG00374 family)